MKIAKNSWHYRFNNYNNDNFRYRFENEYYTTCSYIRTTIASFIAAFIKLIILLVMGALFLFLVGCMTIVPIAIFLGNIPKDIFVGCCLTGWFSAVLILGSMLYTQINERLGRIDLTKQSNVFVQAVIDKHNKFCTRVIAE